MGFATAQQRNFASWRRFLILLGPPRPARLAESTARKNCPHVLQCGIVLEEPPLSALPLRGKISPFVFDGLWTTRQQSGELCSELGRPPSGPEYSPCLMMKRLQDPQASLSPGASLDSIERDSMVHGPCV